VLIIRQQALQLQWQLYLRAALMQHCWLQLQALGQMVALPVEGSPWRRVLHQGRRC
jgi:hypothetical protein